MSIVALIAVTVIALPSPQQQWIHPNAMCANTTCVAEFHPEVFRTILSDYLHERGEDISMLNSSDRHIVRGFDVHLLPDDTIAQLTHLADNDSLLQSLVSFVATIPRLADFVLQLLEHPRVVYRMIADHSHHLNVTQMIDNIATHHKQQPNALLSQVEGRLQKWTYTSDAQSLLEMGLTLQTPGNANSGQQKAATVMLLLSVGMFMIDCRGSPTAKQVQWMKDPAYMIYPVLVRFYDVLCSMLFFGRWFRVLNDLLCWDIYHLPENCGDPAEMKKAATAEALWVNSEAIAKQQKALSNEDNPSTGKGPDEANKEQVVTGQVVGEDGQDKVAKKEGEGEGGGELPEQKDQEQKPA